MISRLEIRQINLLTKMSNSSLNTWRTVSGPHADTTQVNVEPSGCRPVASFFISLKIAFAQRNNWATLIYNCALVKSKMGLENQPEQSMLSILWDEEPTKTLDLLQDLRACGEHYKRSTQVNNAATNSVFLSLCLYYYKYPLSVDAHAPSHTLPPPLRSDRMHK